MFGFFRAFSISSSEPRVGILSYVDKLYSVMFENVICDELMKNDINIDKETFSFHINECLVENKELYDTLSNNSNDETFYLRKNYYDKIYLFIFIIYTHFNKILERF